MKSNIKQINFKYFLFLLTVLNIIIIFTPIKKLNSYYTIRKTYLRENNIIYNEAKLITFADKLNWLAIHDVNRLKGNCSDKILLHEYSKKKIGKDICNKIIKIYLLIIGCNYYFQWDEIFNIRLVNFKNKTIFFNKIKRKYYKWH